jgi:CRP-like cAMP-binding protein
MNGRVSGNDLREIPLFAGLSEEGLARVSAVAAEVRSESGRTLALPDDVGSGMFVLLEGTVAVELHGGDIVVTAPDFVGELALLLPDTGRIGRIRAKTAVRYLAIPRGDFDALVESEPSFTLALLRGLAARLAEARTGH